MAMEFTKFYQKVVKQIDQQLKQLLREWRSEVKNTSVYLVPLVDKFIKSCDDGKKIRGSLVVLGYKLASSKLVDEEIFKIAAAYEIFHSAILAHDDIIDQSLLRRGKRSLYQTLGGNHYGESQTICLGDIGFFLSSKIISEANFSDNTKVQALRWFFKTMVDTGLGQILDINKRDAYTIMKLKTAEYSISGPLQLGAILAGADQRLIKKLGDFGESLGIAFQIQDDLLGIFGKEELLGKPTTSDTEEGKNTILLEFVQKNGSSKEKNILKKMYGRGRIDNQQVKIIKSIFQQTGALKYARKEMIKYKKQAVKIIPEITKDMKMSKILQQLAEYLIERNK